MGKRKAADSGERSENVDGSSHASSGIIEAANALSSFEFMDRYWNWDADEDATLKRFNCTIFCEYVEKLPEHMLQACFDLIEQTSRHDYEPSSFGWHPKRKMKEMKEKEMRYTILTNMHTREVMGFVSFMLTHDSTPAVPVLYVYEIHLNASLRGSGIGKNLMTLVEDMAKKVGVDKVMLTCFKSNHKARAFYERLGYGVDVCSPEDRKTRKKVVKTDYVIMSKDVAKPTAHEPVQKSAMSTVSIAQPPILNPETDEYRALRQQMTDRVAHLLDERNLTQWSQGTDIAKAFDDILSSIKQSGYFEAALALSNVACRKLANTGGRAGEHYLAPSQHAGQVQAIMLMDVIRGFQRRFDAASDLQYQTWIMLQHLRQEMRAVHDVAGAQLPLAPESDRDGLSRSPKFSQITALSGLQGLRDIDVYYDAMPESMQREIDRKLANKHSDLETQKQAIRQSLGDMDEREKYLDQREHQLDQKEDDLFLRETALQEANARQDRARQNIRARARALQQREARFTAREQRDREKVTHPPQSDALGVSAQECEEWRRAFSSAKNLDASVPGIEAQVDWDDDDISGGNDGDGCSDDQDDDLEGSEELDEIDDSEEEQDSMEDSDEEEAESEHSGDRDDEDSELDSYRHDERHQTEGGPRVQGKHIFELPKPEATRGRKVLKHKPQTWLRRSGSTLDSFTKRR
ncbi:putative GNAT domain, acyl-CoA N-acyltransferase, N-alpha-acetyltransferase 40 [Septoria linicola]|nr:putative GNAT domain, acyl-CoA N-acyltransferase, N-alpha-acetyltransferase 40 [Septoria linicola]